ncbi:glycosyltransferase family 4 protein [Exiguobacterium acetylicum]|uniref:glycosyltransferase family 4 protein n=1 Tax=Exiguobacterium acetylicum TaxID=41170 RepID=UPI0039772B40
MSEILFIGPLPPPIHGESIMLNNTLKILKDNDFQTIVFNTGEGRSENNKKYKLFFVKIKNDFKLFLDLLNYKKKSVTYISISQTKFGLLRDCIFIRLRFRKNDYIITHLHGNNLENTVNKFKVLRKIFIEPSLKKINMGVSLSEELEFNYKNLPIELTYVHNCIEPNAEKFLSKYNSENRSEDTKNGVDLNFLYLSNLIDSKGFNELFLAVKIINELTNFKVHLVVAGKCISQKSQSVIEKYSSYEWFEYLGIVSADNKFKIISNSDVVCLPTYYEIEAEPIVLLEGLAAEKVLISTKRAAINKILLNNNFYVEEKNTFSIIEAIFKVINLNKNDLKNIGEKNRKNFLENYSKEKYSKEMLRIFKRGVEYIEE